MSAILTPPEPQKLPDHYEVIDGQIRELTPMSAREALIAAWLAKQLVQWAEPRQGGVVVVEMLFQLDEKGRLQRKPDVAFVARNRIPAGTPIPDENAWRITPTLAVEVVSPSNTVSEIRDKVHDYFGHGVERVWVLLPKTKEAEVYSAPTAVRIFSVHEAVTDDLFPGLSIPLDTVFVDFFR